MSPWSKGPLVPSRVYGKQEWRMKRETRVLNVYSSIDKQMRILDKNLPEKIWIREENQRSGSFVDTRRNARTSCHEETFVDVNSLTQWFDHTFESVQYRSHRRPRERWSYSTPWANYDSIYMTDKVEHFSDQWKRNGSRHADAAKDIVRTQIVANMRTRRRPLIQVNILSMRNSRIISKD